MSEYIRKTWVNGEQIVADDLNRMEEGITEALKGGAAAAVQVVSSHANNKNNPHNVTAEQVGAAAKSQGVPLTVAASAWTGDGPYTATVTCTIAKADNKLIVGAGGALTAEHHEAYTAAMVVCTAQAAGRITLTAFGKAPTIDLPVNVLEVG